jgi:hypothetical protein
MTLDHHELRQLARRIRALIKELEESGVLEFTVLPHLREAYKITDWLAREAKRKKP